MTHHHVQYTTPTIESMIHSRRSCHMQLSLDSFVHIPHRSTPLPITQVLHPKHPPNPHFPTPRWSLPSVVVTTGAPDRVPIEVNTPPWSAPITSDTTGPQRLSCWIATELQIHRFHSILHCLEPLLSLHLRVVLTFLAAVIRSCCC